MSPQTETAARAVLSYLAETESEPTAPVDAVIGFGVFDLTLPVYCAELYRRGLASRILFTGGIGAGTGNLGGPEADVWREVVRKTHPQISDEAFVLENRSTNTAENINYTADALGRLTPPLAFGTDIKSAVIVASPSRLRRVRVTLWKLQPQLQVVRCLPGFSFAAEEALYARQGVNYLEHLVGELDRLTTYPARGWIAAEPIPADIIAAGEVLRAQLNIKH